MRLLFFFSDTGGGHRSAACAVRDALQRRDKSPHITLIDIFKAGPWPFPQFPALWPLMIKLHGVPWGLFYRATDHRTVVNCMTRAVWPYVKSRLCTLLSAHPADAIVSFHPLANDVLSLAQCTFGELPPMMSVSQDLVNVHAATFAPHFAYHVVPTAEARERALRWPVDAARVHVAGVPTRPHFAELRDLPQRAARVRLGLPPSSQVALFVGGGDGVGPLLRVVRAVARRPTDTPRCLAVITGRNRHLHRRLDALNTGPCLRVEGYVQNMALWMRAADLLVTKAGPNTLAEAFITGCPMVLYNAIPGQETGNVRYVVEHGAGFWAPRPLDATRRIHALLESPARRQVLADRARALACPHATEKIINLIQTLVYDRERFQPR